MIDRNSYGSLALVYALSLVAAAAVVFFVHAPLVKWPLLALLLWFCIWQTFFFNVPRRGRAGSGRMVSSVADGRVVIVRREMETELLGRECIQVSVYMNFFDVHANFWPVDGTVVDFKYYPGDHILAFHQKSSLLNEHCTTLIRTDDGREVVFRQVAGGFARRIVCYSKPGLKVRAGDQCGIIKFGSRIDCFFPLDTDIKVREGDLVRASETVLAQL